MSTIVRRQVEQTSALSASMHPVLNRVYAARGIASAQELDKRLEQLLPYHALSNIDAAVHCLYQALQEQKTVVIMGDFDADGATSCALAVSALKVFGLKNLHYLVPNRFEYGYGLTPEIVEVARGFSPQLLITVDSGISCLAGVKAAKAAGIQVLITDHHLPGANLPEADVIINPNLPGDIFASKNLAGVGVIFYLMLALRRFLREQNWFATQQLAEPNMGQFLDLVALGTVADVVPLDKNNRILVHQGLQRIRAGLARPGIKALLKVSARTETNLVAADLGFALGPRLNAAGRLDDMSLGIRALLATNEEEAMVIAQQLDTLNNERRTIEADMQQQAFAQLDKLNWHQLEQYPAGVCLFDAGWHQGVIGILASRVKDKLHRPVVVFAKASETELKGSARSVAGVHIRDVFQAIDARYPGLITKFGGHAMAAGIALPQAQLETFTQAFAEEIARQLGTNSLQQIIHSDGELAEQEVNLSLAEILREAEPWGQAFPEPLFDGVFQIIEQRIVGSRHLKLRLCWPEGQRLIDAIAFNVDLELWPNHRCENIRLVYKLDVNEFNGRRNVQFIVQHLEAC